jgi:hypothetical protein
MAYVGCIAGAIEIDEYKRGLIEAGFSNVEVIDSGSDLNTYAKIENQPACCSPSVSNAASVGTACCSPAPSVDQQAKNRLAELLTRYNVNDYAASVRVFAVKEDVSRQAK